MSEPRIIALETSGRMGSVAIAQGGALIEQSEFTADREHARDLLPILNTLLEKHGWKPADVGHVYLSVGPGSFTGLRVAVTFARHFALAVGAQLCAVPTLDVIAENGLQMATPPDRLAVVLDAKSKRVFGAHYRLEGAEYVRDGEPVLEDAVTFLRRVNSPVKVFGEGTLYHGDAIRETGCEIVDMAYGWPRAEYVHRLGWKLTRLGRFTPANELVPFYLRRPEAEEIWERRQKSGS